MLADNGLVEITNRTILQGLKKRLDSTKANWVEKLPSVLGSYRTTPRRATGESLFNLCFGLKALIPAEVWFSSAENVNFYLRSNNRLLEENLLLIDSVREEATKRDECFKRAIARYHHSRIRHLSIRTRDLVFMENKVSWQEPVRKFDATWEGPYKVI